MERGAESEQCAGIFGFGAEEIDVCECLLGGFDIGEGGAQARGDVLQDAYALASLGTFEFADMVVRLYYLLGLNEDSLSGGGLIVDDAADFAFVGRWDGYDESAFAHGGGGVFVEQAFSLRLAEDLVESSADGALCGCHLAADAAQFGAGIVCQATVLIEDTFDESEYEEDTLVVALVIADGECGEAWEACGVEGSEEGLQTGSIIDGLAEVEEFGFIKEESLNADACKGLAHIVDFAAGEVERAVFEDTLHLICLIEQACDFGGVVGERHGIYLLFAKGGCATAAELVANGGEVYFMLNGVHGFLLQKRTKIITKMNEKFFSINKYFQILGKYFLEHIIVRVIIH